MANWIDPNMLEQLSRQYVRYGRTMPKSNRWQARVLRGTHKIVAYIVVPEIYVQHDNAVDDRLRAGKERRVSSCQQYAWQ